MVTVKLYVEGARKRPTWNAHAAEKPSAPSSRPRDSTDVLGLCRAAGANSPTMHL